MEPKKLIEKLQRLAGASAIVLVIVLVLLVSVWKTLFKYVRTDEMLVLIAKTGDELPADEILAGPGQKGIRKEVYGEGRHFVMPFFYDYEIVPVKVIEPGQVGVVSSKVGEMPPAGQILVDESQRGIWRKVLPPGKYRMNPRGYEIEVHPAVVIKPSFVGFVKRKVGNQPRTGKYADPAKDEQGIVRDVLPPGVYYLNPYEYEVREVEVGINQITFLGPGSAERKGDTSVQGEGQIQFPSKDAFPIALDATVEWELLPENVAPVMAQFGERSAIEDKVIVPQSKSIGRTEGSKYGAKELLLGEGREKFQHTFQDELVKVCKEKGITINSAFIRHIEIPDDLLKPIRDKKVADEERLTAAFWERTRKSAALLEREKTMIDQERQKVRSELQAEVREIAADADKAVREIDAETRVKVAEIDKQIAEKEADATRTLGGAEAAVTRMKGEAAGAAFAHKVSAFSGDAGAYARYSFAESLPQGFRVRVLETGPGTLWTDLEKTAGLREVESGKTLRDGQGQAPRR